MKFFKTTIIIIFCSNFAFSQITEFKAAKIFKYKSEKDFDYILINNIPKFYKIKKGILDQNYLPNVNVKFKINPNTNLLEDFSFVHHGFKEISSPKFCQAFLEKNDSPSYDMNTILKYFAILRSDTTLNWNDQEGCVSRSSKGYNILKRNKIKSLKAIAMPALEKCYSDFSENMPLWSNHIANVIHCNDGEYYVLDPFIDNEKPLKYMLWQDSITVKPKDCESFFLYKGNSVVIPILNKNKKFEFTVLNNDCF